MVSFVPLIYRDKMTKGFYEQNYPIRPQDGEVIPPQKIIFLPFKRDLFIQQIPGVPKKDIHI